MSASLPRLLIQGEQGLIRCVSDMTIIQIFRSFRGPQARDQKGRRRDETWYGHGLFLIGQ